MSAPDVTAPGWVAVPCRHTLEDIFYDKTGVMLTPGEAVDLYERAKQAAPDGLPHREWQDFILYWVSRAISDEGKK